MATAYDRVALLLAIKERGKAVEFDHIFEKVGRDVAFADKRELRREEVEQALSRLVSQGYAVKKEAGYEATSEIERLARKLVEERRNELNRSYVMVWLAKQYYPHVAEAMVPFLTGRAVSAVKIFSGKSDPIAELDTIFVRYSKYKPKPVFLTIDSPDRLLELVFDHCVDFIPYVHKLGAREPDVFVLDLDAGSRILQHSKAFEFVKYVTSELAALLEDLGIGCMVKFSGSRGFQIWASFDNARLRTEEDVFKKYREMAVALQAKLEERLQKNVGVIQRKFSGVIEQGQPITTSVVAHKEERASQVLFDWSVLKPMGDVRAPFSIHYKTGLASVPISGADLEDFNTSDAKPLNILENLSRYRQAAEVGLYDPSRLLAFT